MAGYLRDIMRASGSTPPFSIDVSSIASLRFDAEFLENSTSVLPSKLAPASGPSLALILSTTTQARTINHWQNPYGAHHPAYHTLNCQPRLFHLLQPLATPPAFKRGRKRTMSPALEPKPETVFHLF